MAIFSMRRRKRLVNYGVGAAAGLCAVIIQTTLLSQFPVRDNTPVYCNLPLALTICWGAVSGSPLPSITPDDLRMSSSTMIFIRQLLSGSISGFLMGFFLAAVSCSISGFVGDDAMHAVRVFPAYLPVAGFVSGYFCLRQVNMQKFLIMPLVFVLSLLAESMMAWQLSLMGRPGVFTNLSQIAVHEAALNSIISPLVYMPARTWYDFAHGTAPSSGADA